MSWTSGSGGEKQIWLVMTLRGQAVAAYPDQRRAQQLAKSLHNSLGAKAVAVEVDPWIDHLDRREQLFDITIRNGNVTVSWSKKPGPVALTKDRGSWGGNTMTATIWAKNQHDAKAIGQHLAGQ